jgi:propionyl-CoA synthetase
LQISAEIVKRVRDEVGPVAAFHTVIIVARLPKTRSGKVLRATMKAIADGVEYRAPGTIDDPATLGEIEAAFKELQKRQQGKGGKASSAADHAAAVAQKLKL